MADGEQVEGPSAVSGGRGDELSRCGKQAEPQTPRFPDLAWPRPGRTGRGPPTAPWEPEGEIPSGHPAVSDAERRLGLTVIEYAKPGVALAWLEKGNVGAGLVHIMFRHAGEFAAAGVRVEDIPALVKTALTQGTRVSTQGAGRPVFEVAFQGKTLRVAVSVGDNGYVIGANIA